MSEAGGADEATVREAVEHLQGAARELIAAARVLLDITEDLVNDPAPLLGAVTSLADLGRLVISVAHPADGQNEHGSRPASRVEHIRVS